MAQFSSPSFTVEKYDSMRSFRAWIYGGIVFAPLGTKWYPYLDKLRIPGQKTSTTGNNWKSTAFRVGVDQLVFTPCAISLYFGIMGLMQQKTLTEIKKGWQENFVSTLLVNWTVWPTFQAVNFTLIPVGYRLLAVNVVSLGWNTFLSHKYSKTNEIKKE